MGESTSIAWTDGTFNPWWGCVEVSPACDNCYARTWDARFNGDHWGKDAPRRFFGDKHWNEPLKWNKAAAASGERFLVFCASMSDVFEVYHPRIGGSESGESALNVDPLDEHRLRLFDLIRKTPHLTWLLLTKRPQNIGRMLPADLKAARHIWLGTTVESSDYLWRAERLTEYTWAAVRFLSCEPLLSDLDIESVLTPRDTGKRGIDWVIAGGESGTGARELNMSRVRRLRDACVDARKAFLFKQADEGLDGVTVGDGSFTKRDVRKGADGIGRVHRIVERPYLDGVQWMQFPEVRP